ncbi:hypothetical protein HPULCUR_002619 [Helicostylum pulchrum]|uniref:Acyl-coenzyme A oxidase N-terminal domain-containing protein n=1 Tax=Helicostylum pulchrum TaxID=562976 RepID=A0ABP9XR10_9FUNG
MSNNKTLVQMNIDIEEARQKADFSIDSMLNLLRGGEEAVKKLNDLRQLAENEPVFSKAETPFQSRQEQLYHSLLIAKRMIELVEENNMDDEQFANLFRNIELLTPVSYVLYVTDPLYNSNCAPFHHLYVACSSLYWYEMLLT